MDAPHPNPRPRRVVAGTLLATLTIATLLLAGYWTSSRRGRPTAAPTQPGQVPSSSSSDRRITPDVARQLAAIEAAEADAAQRYWPAEHAADACTGVIDALWDSLNASTQKLALAASWPQVPITLPSWPDHSADAETQGIRRFPPSAPERSLDPDEWKRTLAHAADEGWLLVQSEFRHVRFQPASTNPDAPARSTFQCAWHLVRNQPPERAVFEGPVEIAWDPADSPAAPPRPAAIDASRLTLARRTGRPPLVPILEATVPPPPRGQNIDPLVIHDLDQDGIPEILLVARNRYYRRGPHGAYEEKTLCQPAPDSVYTAVLGDFDGDGWTDLLTLGFAGLQLYPGTGKGPFTTPPRLVWKTGSSLPLEFPMVLSAGDIDLDGDLDLFLGQYKDPYEGGSTPTPYFAATNGHPAYLLTNDGTGTLRDATANSGLQPWRGRRVYSASFADLDRDGDLDLLTASDFAGIDLYANDGRGRFENTTSRWVGNPHAFGMAHVLADLNADGFEDLLMIGMTSPTVDRLEHLGLHRPGLPGPPGRRADMTHGNRLYLGSGTGPFQDASDPLGHTIARSGWSWGCTAADLDLDGFPDVHIVNGLESRESVREYEAEYWRHDMFVQGAADSPAALLYFKAKNARTRGRGMSYGGYEKNRLYLNRQGRAFLEAGHLLGVALESDCRNAVSADVDLDGDPDLVVTGFETWPAPRQTLRVYRNDLERHGHWIQFALADQPGGRSPIGVRVDLRAGPLRASHTIVTGDSHRSQHPPVAHFGLGALPSGNVDEVSVTWPGGDRLVLKDIAADRVHPIRRAR